MEPPGAHPFAWARTSWKGAVHVHSVRARPCRFTRCPSRHCPFLSGTGGGGGASSRHLFARHPEAGSWGDKRRTLRRFSCRRNPSSGRSLAFEPSPVPSSQWCALPFGPSGYPIYGAPMTGEGGDVYVSLTSVLHNLFRQERSGLSG